MFKELDLFTTSKVLIINEDIQRPFLIDLIQNKSSSQELNNSKCLFDYFKLDKSNKTINFFETSEVYKPNILSFSQKI